MSKVIRTDKHDNHIEYLVDSASTAKTRKGVKYSFSPRKSVQHWSNYDSGSGDLWLTDNLLTEDVRKAVEAVATVIDSPYKKSEKKLVLKDDTHANRVALFKQIIKMCGGQF